MRLIKSPLIKNYIVQILCTSNYYVIIESFHRFSALVFRLMILIFNIRLCLITGYLYAPFEKKNIWQKLYWHCQSIDIWLEMEKQKKDTYRIGVHILNDLSTTDEYYNTNTFPKKPKASFFAYLLSNNTYNSRKFIVYSFYWQ